MTAPRVTLRKIKGPDKDRWARGEGAEYEVALDSRVIGKVYCVRTATPAPRGTRIRSGASSNSWRWNRSELGRSGGSASYDTRWTAIRAMLRPLIDGPGVAWDLPERLAREAREVR